MIFLCFISGFCADLYISMLEIEIYRCPVVLIGFCLEMSRVCIYNRKVVIFGVF